MRPHIIGVTGVIGSGKSTVCRFLQDHYGYHWINADDVTHDLYKVGNAGYKKIREYFGEQFVGPREVYRGRLRRLVLKSSPKLWILNKLMHSLIAHEVNKKIIQQRQKVQSAVLPPHTKEMRLLVCIEAVYFEPQDLGKFIDKLIIVDVPDAVIMRRFMHDKKRKKIPESDLRTLLLFQRKNRVKVGTIIKNNSTRRVLLSRLHHFVSHELRMIP